MLKAQAGPDKSFSRETILLNPKVNDQLLNILKIHLQDYNTFNKIPNYSISAGLHIWYIYHIFMLCLREPAL